MARKIIKANDDRVRDVCSSQETLDILNDAFTVIPGSLPEIPALVYHKDKGLIILRGINSETKNSKKFIEETRELLNSEYPELKTVDIPIFGVVVRGSEAPKPFFAPFIYEDNQLESVIIDILDQCEPSERPSVSIINSIIKRLNPMESIFPEGEIVVGHPDKRSRSKRLIPSSAVYRLIETILSQAFVEAKIYLSGVEVTPSEVSRPDWMLPALLVGVWEYWSPVVIEKKGRGGFHFVLAPNEESLLGYTVKSITPSSMMLLSLPLSKYVSTMRVGDRVDLDLAVSGFIRWLNANRMDSLAASDADMKIALMATQ